MAHDVGVREIRVGWRTEARVLDPVSGRSFFSKFARDDPAVAISGPSVVQIERVNHTSAIERICVMRVGLEARVGSVSHRLRVDLSLDHNPVLVASRGGVGSAANEATDHLTPARACPAMVIA